MRPLLLTTVCCALLPGLCGCVVWRGVASLVRPTPQVAEVRPAPAPGLVPPDPAAVVDRLYARAADAIRARDYALALEVLQIAAARTPADARVLNAQAVVYDKLGRFDLSARYYARALAADPGSTIVAHNMAYSARLSGRAGPDNGPLLAGGSPAAATPAGRATSGGTP
ncbi:tetratricopeptide repeat protein [Caulobacter sp. UNC279MFTsu5.1]|uniref:tetratricopeptide repeat protein n=1 Tax=Caulobacter sp. UNC279MFTsu5.1 TaxID=1502775 RepID=UPI0008E16A48|nr:tetratricopeptide repeat protein [Caulobacter sp. UNC279MFTsu5.1]SFJ65875.1 Tetratricopeptide repeat-containing protein [Caulobacter sp. UNC279MFTsu5.1]